MSCDGVQWIWKHFAECVSTNTQIAAFYLGLLSIVCWIGAQIPQIYLNYRSGKAEESLSPLFITQWLLGDATNFLGALLSHQLMTQIATAGYFCFIDVVLIAQYMYYWKKNKVTFQDLTNSLRLPCVLVLGTLTCTVVPLHIAQGGSVISGGGVGRSLLGSHISFFENATDEAGYFLGVMSAILYISSRLPQIYHTFRRKRADGLSPLMFILAVLGNLTYAMGILLYDQSEGFILHKLPWLVGSIGTLVFDGIIIVQFSMYKDSGYTRLADQEGLLSEHSVQRSGSYSKTINVDKFA